MSLAVARDKTALTRTKLSRPFSLAVEDQLLVPAYTIFDYGCGRGDDLRHLTAAGFAAAGWDPTHRPAAAKQPADVVNLGYVVNVIEDPTERTEALTAAWVLARKLLIVAARLVWDARDLTGRPHRDGILTRTGTFQKFYEQAELATWIEQTLGERPYAAAPGVFYVFRDPAAAQQFLASRVAASRPRVRLDPDALYAAHQDALAPLLDFITAHARSPRAGELTSDAEAGIRATVGSLSRGSNLIRRVIGDERSHLLIRQRRRDLLVYIALSRFGRRPRIGTLPTTLATDIKALFGSYQAACAQADQLLFAAGNLDLLSTAASSSPIGKLTPTALYVHRSALGELPVLLRLYEGCGRVLAGTVEGANLVKLSVKEPQVSYLAYPRFDRDAHPTLAAAVTIKLGNLTVDLRDYTRSDNPPLLHRKEEFIGQDDPRRDLYTKLTRAEIRAGLYTHPERIGTKRGWEETLAEHGVQIRGHRVARTPPARHGKDPVQAAGCSSQSAPGSTMRLPSPDGRRAAPAR